MNMINIVKRKNPPAPWESGEKIPWNDPAFSERMLKNHLSQDHDWASRRESVIERHTGWIAQRLPDRARVLDLGCGPGLYTHRLAAMGYECVGVDFSPASIAYAGERAIADGYAIDYVLADIREYIPQGLFDVILMTFGEFNVFRENEASALACRAESVLKQDGFLLVEAHTFDEVFRQGNVPASWQAEEEGVFSDSPHCCLQENFWDETSSTATTRYFVVDARTSDVTEYGASMKAYTDEQYVHMFERAGFAAIERVSVNEWPTGEIFEGKLQTFMCSRGLPVSRERKDGR